MACRLHLQAGGLEVLNALLEQWPRGGRFGVLPKSVGCSAHEAPALHRVGHVRGGALEELRGVLVGASRDGRFGCCHAHSHRLLEVAGHQQVVREVDRLPAGLRFEDLGDAGMQLLAARNDDVLVHGFTRERVPEHVAARGAVRFLEQLVGDARLERGKDGGAAPAGDRAERRQVKGLADRGGGRQDLDVVGAEAADPDQDGVADRARHPDLVYRLAVPSLVGLEDVATVDGVAQQLLEHDRVPFAALMQEVAELVAHVGLVEDRDHHFLHRLRAQRRELDEVCLPRATPALDGGQQGVLAVQLVGAVRGQDEHVGVAQPARGVVDQLARGRVGPVQVFEHQQEATLAGRVAQEQQDRLEEPQLGLHGIARGRLRAAHLREQLRKLLGGRPEALAQGGDVLGGKVVADRLQER